MKNILIAFFLVCSSMTCFSQNRKDIIDRLKHQLALSKSDTNQVIILHDLCLVYRQVKSDSALFFGEKALDLARKLNFIKGEVDALINLSSLFRIQGDISKSLKFRLMSLEIIEQKAPLMDKNDIWNGIGLIYLDIEDHPKALEYFRKALSSTESSNYGNVLMNMERTFINSNQLDSALHYAQKAYNWGKKKFPNYIYSPFYLQMGIIQFRLGNRSLGFENLHKSILGGLKDNDHRWLSDSYSTISVFFKETNRLDSCLFYAKKGLIEGQAISYQKGILINANLLAEQYEPKDVQQALYYHKIAKAANEELYGVKRTQALQKNMADEQERQREIETERIAKENRLKLYSLFAGLGMVLLIASILYRNNRQKQKANIILEKTLSTLKSTQAQLIQSEKLASLGELTAGIAHEIQNPLNFVNNFSEMSVELAKELKEEIKKPDKDWELIDDLTNDLEQNQEKINHHGKRAASIVKGMLEHSKASTGKKESTNINALVDEYSRLAYSNLRSKNDDSTVAVETHLDDTLPKTVVIPQDIGRVLLNLMNNAFWAVQEQGKRRTEQGISDYQPIVTLTTKAEKGQISIGVKDNGIGMSEATKAKVFQPFFTTKPTGQGTGLGLSLAYDIVTKGHGGTMEVESEVGQFTEFIITLSIKSA